MRFKYLVINKNLYMENFFGRFGTWTACTIYHNQLLQKKGIKIRIQFA